MKEQEFDKYIRDVMLDAEETVSPEVWSGIARGLEKRRKVVPVRVWRAVAGVAAVAAAVAAVLFLRPGDDLSNQPIIYQPATLAEAPAPSTVSAEQQTPVAPITQQVSRLQKRTAFAPEALLLEESASAVTSVQPDQPVRGPAAEQIPDRIGTQETLISDEQAYNQLAFEEHKKARTHQWSVALSGNLQGNNRPNSPAAAIRRSAPGMLFAPKTTGIDENPEFNFGLPVSGGIGIRYNFGPRWGIGTGITYTNLSRSFIGSFHEVKDGELITDVLSTDIDNQQHYVGIPLNLYFSMVNVGHWNLHALVGGSVERLVDNHFLIHSSDGNIHYHQKADGFQTSVAVGFGAEFKFTPYLSLYIDPTLRYYFDNGQPRSIRTIQPLRMDFEAGLRFNLGQ